MATDILWNHSIFDQELYTQLEELQENSLNFHFHPDEREVTENSTEEFQSDSTTTPSSLKLSKKPEAQEILLATERSCCTALQALEKLLEPLRLTLSDHKDVTGRTNSIVSSCEMLLEKQVSRLYVYYSF